MKFKDYSNKKYFHLTLKVSFNYEDNTAKRIGWVAICDCGQEVRLKSGGIAKLKLGKIKSCGCYKANRLTKHNGSRNSERLYSVWRSMRARCNGLSNINFKYYGGRGIKICKDWESYLSFKKWSLDNGYNENLTIDRIDNDGGYSPENCRWVTQAENNKNRVHWTKKPKHLALKNQTES